MNASPLSKTLVRKYPPDVRSWMVAAFRQDELVWDALTSPSSADRFECLSNPENAIQPEDWTPMRLSMLAAGVSVPLSGSLSSWLHNLDADLSQAAAQAYQQFNTGAQPLTLQVAGNVALALAQRVQAGQPISALLADMASFPGLDWTSIMACLYSLMEDPAELLHQVAVHQQPAAAVQMLLRQPLPVDAQVNVLLHLASGDFARQPLASSSHMALLRALTEQNRSLAVEYSKAWLSTSLAEPESCASGPKDTQGALRHLEDWLFFDEIYQLAGESANIATCMLHKENSYLDLSAALVADWIRTPKGMDEEAQSASAQVWKSLLPLFAPSDHSPTQASINRQAQIALALLDAGMLADAATLLPVDLEQYAGTSVLAFAGARLASAQGNSSLAEKLARSVMAALQENSSACCGQCTLRAIRLERFAEYLLDIGLLDESVQAVQLGLVQRPNDPTLLGLHARALIQDHRHAEAIQPLQIAISLFPSRLDFRRQLAGCLEKTSDHLAAVEEWDAIVGILTTQSHALAHNELVLSDLHALARSAILAEKYPRAMEACQAARQIDPDDSLAIAYHGEALAHSGDIDHALEELARATQINPQLPEPWLIWARIYQHADLPEMAVESLQTAAQTLPDDAQIHYALGDLHMRLDQVTLAVESFRQAALLSPSDPQIALRLGQCLSRLGHTAEARQQLEKSYSANPRNAEAAYAYARLLLAAGEPSPAIAPLEDALKFGDGSDPQAYLDYARAVLAVDRQSPSRPPIDKVIYALQHAIDLDKEIPEAQGLLAEALAENGEHAASLRAFQAAMDSPLVEQPGWLARLSLGLGRAAMSLGHNETAIAALQEAAQADPHNPAIHKSISSAYHASKLHDNALASARTALNLNIEDPEMLTWYAEQVINIITCDQQPGTHLHTESAKQALSEALNALDLATRLAPDRSDLILRLGDMQSRLGDSTAAQQTYRKMLLTHYATSADLKSASARLLRFGDSDNAVACLEKAIQLASNAESDALPEIYSDLAQVHAAAGDLRTAVEILDKSIAIGSDCSSFYWQKSAWLVELGRRQEAVACIEQGLAQACSPRQFLPLYHQGMLISRVGGDLTAALKYAALGLDAREQLSLTHAADLKTFTLHAADLYRAVLQPEKARQVLAWLMDEPSIQLDPGQDAQLICLSRELALEAGDPAAETDNLPVSSESDPAYPRLLALKARITARISDEVAALKMLHAAQTSAAALASQPLKSELDQTIQSYWNQSAFLGTALELHQWQPAEECARKMIELLPAEPLAHLALTQVFTLQGELGELGDSLNAITHFPTNPDDAEARYNAFTSAVNAVQHSLSVLPHKISEADRILAYWQARGEALSNDETLEATSTSPFAKAIKTRTIRTARSAAQDAAALIAAMRRTSARNCKKPGLAEIFQIVRNYAQDSKVLLQLALTLEESHPQDALNAARSAANALAVKNSSHSAVIHALIARLANRLGNNELASQAISTALEIWPDEPRWQSLAANICWASGETSLGINHLETAIRLEPKNLAHHLALGELYLATKDTDPLSARKAMRTLERVCNLAPDDPRSWLALAHAQNQASEYDLAARSAEKVLALSPDHLEALMLRSEIALNAGRLPDAYDYAQKAKSVAPASPQTTMLIVHTLQAMERNTEALKLVERALDEFPEDLDFQIEQASLLQQLRQPQAAIELLQTLTLRQPENVYVLKSLAHVQATSGQFDSSVQTLQNALKMCANLPSASQAELHAMLGHLFRQSGQLDQAIHHLSEAIRLYPNLLDAYLELGLARKERREYKLALDIFQQATNIAPQDPRPAYQAGLALKEGKDYRGSEAMLRRAASLAPSDVNIRRQLAAVVALNLVHNPKSISMRGE